MGHKDQTVAGAQDRHAGQPARPSNTSDDLRRYQLLFEHSSDAVLWIDALAFRFIEVNPTACDWLGYERDEIVGMPVGEIDAGLSPDDLTNYLAELNRDGAGTIVSKHRRKDGSTFPVQIHSQVIEDRERRIYHCIVHDLTERLPLDEARKHADASFDAAGRMARVGAWELILASGKTVFSREVSRIYGIPPGEAPPVEEGISYYPPDARPVIVGAVEEAIRTGTPYDLVLPFVDAGGHRLWVRTIGEAEYHTDGQPYRLYGAIQDITQQRHAELLTQAQLFMQARAGSLTADDDLTRMLETFDNGLALNRVPLDCCLVVVADALDSVVERYVRTADTDWRRLDASGSDDDAERLAGALRRARGETGHDLDRDALARLMGKQPAESHCLVAASGLVTCWIAAPSGVTLSADDAEVLNALTTVLELARARLHDLAQTRAHNRQLLQAQKMESLGRLAGGVAHDFNNLLAAILGVCELSQLEGGVMPPADVELVADSAHRAQTLTQQLLAYSRAQVLQPTVIRVNDVVRDVASLLSRLVGKRIRIEEDLQSVGSQVLFDPGRLEQVLLNLAVNARDAMPSGGVLTIHTSDFVVEDECETRTGTLPRGHYLKLSVRDSGMGLTPDAKLHLFEPFFTTKEPGKGTGLGLATVHGTVTQSGGYLDVASVPGEGTVFHIYLPSASEAAAAMPAPPESPRDGTVAPEHPTRSILVVEDDPVVRRLVRRMLQQTGYDVEEAAGVADLRGKLTELARPDLVLSDVVMPDGSGLTTAEMIRRQFGPTPFVFMSGHAARDLIGETLATEGSLLLQKPFSIADLLDALQRALNSEHMRV